MKTILITGATGGIGKAAALELATLGHHIIIHGRNREKTEHVVSELRQKTNNPNIDYVLADLFSLQEVKNMAQTITNRFDKLDVIIHNAGGVFSMEYESTIDGIEKTIALNLAAPLLLTELLLPLLKKSKGRIIYTSSASSNVAFNPDMQALDLSKYGAQRRYNYAKLYTLWIMQEQAKLFEPYEVTVSASHPGMVDSNFGKTDSKGFWTDLVYKTALLLNKFFPQLANSAEEGAAADVYLALNTDTQLSGKFYGTSKGKVSESMISKRKNTQENRKLAYDFYRNYITPFL